MTKAPRPLAEMEQIAHSLCATLAPYVERCEVAGSVRRRKALCSDIELVAIPRMQPAGLFGDRQESALHAFLKQQPALVFLKGDNPDGRYHQLQLPDGVQVDLFLAQQENFGWTLVVRTGSADFSQAMLVRWKARRGIGKEGKGSVDGRLVNRLGEVISTPEEQDVFNAVGVAYVAPEQRHDGSVLRNVR